MTQRLDYHKISPDGVKGLFGGHAHMIKAVPRPLLDLLWLRVSQINGCAYCVDLHSRDARKAGVGERRLYNVATWHESPFFTPRERAAFAWAESLTLVSETHAPDADYDAVRQHFTDKEVVDLTYAIALMNALNRLGVGFRNRPAGDAD